MTDLVKTACFNIPPIDLWEWLTDKEKLGKWFHPANVDLEEGAEYHLMCPTEDGGRKPLIWGRVLKADPPKELTYSFNIKPLEGRETIVTWVLHPIAGEGTRLTLTHSGLGALNGETPLSLIMALDDGWDEHIRALRGTHG